MKTTNKQGYPDNIVRALSPEPYRPNPKRIGVTSLIGAPLPRTLKQRHYDVLSEDVDDMLYAFHGNMADEVVKSFAGPWDLVKVKMEVETFEGFTLVGKPDIVSIMERLIRDIKYVSTFAVIFPENRVYWEKQLNLYDWMLQLVIGDSIKIEGLQVQALLRDFNKRQAGHGDYPKHAIHIIDIPRWSHKEQTEFIEERLRDHLENPERECTPEEKWQTATTWAVKKKGAKRATRVLDSEAEAIEFIKEKGDKTLLIEKRKGQCKKCEEYCIARYVCPYSGLKKHETKDN